ncbi:signal peptidase [Rhodococcus sp. OK519]|uniref:signal peptidase I n=1 Tax=Rhodococcus sp. OK519 TaxID=2135729 RepID=UPI000D3D912A|nr:signal peptidase [Rhodococcus sp. OK519]
MAVQSSNESRRSRGREIALNVGAVAGLICVLAATGSLLFGIKPLIFRSGSMSPDIPTGALALSKTTPASDLKVGDVVSVSTEQGIRITHRVDEIASSEGSTSVLILKGDANQDADVTPYTVTEADRVFFSVPALGYVVSWLSSPVAIFLGGVLVGGVLVLAFGSGSKRKDGDSESSDMPGDLRPEYPLGCSKTAAGLPTESIRS